MSIPFNELMLLAGDADDVAATCPSCQAPKALRIWIKPNGYALYSCRKCGQQGAAFKPTKRFDDDLVNRAKRVTRLETATETNGDKTK